MHKYSTSVTGRKVGKIMSLLCDRVVLPMRTMNGWIPQPFTAGEQVAFAEALARIDKAGLQRAQGSTLLISKCSNNRVAAATLEGICTANKMLRERPVTDLPLAIDAWSEVADYRAAYLQAIMAVPGLPAPGDLVTLAETCASLHPERYINTGFDTLQSIGYVALGQEQEVYGCLLPETGEYYYMTMDVQHASL